MSNQQMIAYAAELKQLIDGSPASATETARA